MASEHDLQHAPARRIARNAVVRAGGEAIGKLASIAFFIVMARELGQAGFGDFMFAFSLGTVLMLASGLGTEELIAREVARDHGRVHGYLGNIASAKAVISVLLLLLAALIVNLGDWPHEARIASYIIVAGVAIENLGRTWHAVFTAYERLDMISISLVIQRVLTAAVGIAVMEAGGGLIAVSVVFSLGAVTGFLIATQVLRHWVVAARWELDRSRWVPLLRAGVPIGIASVIFVVLMRIDATLLGLLTGGDDNSEVGVYAAAFRLVEGTLFISWAVAASVLPWLSRQTEAADVSRGYELGVKAITTVLMPIGLGFVLLATPLIHLLYGAEYDDAVTPLRLLGVMTVLYGANSMASTVLISRDRPQDFTRIAAWVTAFNVVLNLILIPSYGADGAAFVAALSALMLASLSMLVVGRKFGHIRLLRAFGAPLAGALAMTAVVLPTDLPLVAAAAVGGLAYVAGALAFERVAFPQDFSRLRGALSRGVRSAA
ncbi:MAG TPA: flippase [Thermoleophilaceae bacterium]|jgi:O-antigen/teichoic acid export membrane protein